MKFNVGIIGVGKMGVNHFLACKQLGYNVIAVCDTDQSRLNYFKQQNQDYEYSLYTSVEKMLSNHNFDLIIIATTAPSHESLINIAIDNNVKKILCEKPLSTSIYSGELIFQRALRHNVDIAVNHQMRYLSQYMIIKKLINSGTYGHLVTMNVSASNFGLAMNGTHYFEAFRWLVQEPIRYVFSLLDSDPIINPRGAEFLDYSGQVIGKTASNKKLYLDFDRNSGNGIVVTYNFNYGKVTINELTGEVSQFKRKADYLTLPTSRYGCESEHLTSFIPAIDLVASTASVIKALTMGEDYPNLNDGLHAMSVALAAVYSTQTNNIIVNLESRNFATLNCHWA